MGDELVRHLRLLRGLAEEPHGFLPRAVQRHPERRQYLPRGGFLFGDEPEQEMFGTDVAVLHQARFCHGQLDRLFAARRVRQVRSGNLALGSRPEHVQKAVNEMISVDAEVGENRCRDAVPFARDRQQDVLGSHVRMAEIRGFDPRAGEDLSNALREVVAVHDHSDYQSFRNTRPSFITNTTRRSASMSRDGSPSTAIRSASFPTAMVPNESAIPSARAPSDVADTMASIGFWPASRTRHTSSSTLRPWAPATASVPKTTSSPGVAIAC